MLFGETVAAYCENPTEHKCTNALCGQNAAFWYLKERGIYSDHLAFNEQPIGPCQLSLLVQVSYLAVFRP
jgi:hypothetical protein